MFSPKSMSNLGRLTVYYMVNIFNDCISLDVMYNFKKHSYRTKNAFNQIYIKLKKYYFVGEKCESQILKK